MANFRLRNSFTFVRRQTASRFWLLLAFVLANATTLAADEPLPGKRSKWNDFVKVDFPLGEQNVTVVLPNESLEGKPWVWHGEFFGHKPAPDIALLEKGFHIVYMRVPNLLGAPVAVEHWNRLYRFLIEKHGFAKKVALVGLSRGGLYCYNWAIANPESVACVYGDAPVCDFKSWPGGAKRVKGMTGKGSDRDWKLVLKTYGFESDKDAIDYDKNPVDQLAALAKAKVPLLHVYGDSDVVVPWKENTGLVADRYREMGGNIQLIAKKGIGHHPHGLEDSTPIVDFLYKNSMAQFKN